MRANFFDRERGIWLYSAKPSKRVHWTLDNTSVDNIVCHTKFTKVWCVNRVGCKFMHRPTLDEAITQFRTQNRGCGFFPGPGAWEYCRRCYDIYQEQCAFEYNHPGVLMPHLQLKLLTNVDL